jgi:hypothetical protein
MQIRIGIIFTARAKWLTSQLAFKEMYEYNAVYFQIQKYVGLLPYDHPWLVPLPGNAMALRQPSSGAYYL